MKRTVLIVAVIFTAALAAKGRITKGEGLQYEVIKAGNGKVAQVGQRVQVHYTGWLNEGGKKGKKFDSSVDRRKPFVFGLGQGMVIRGWDEGVAGMKVGEKRTLFIPAALGYGSRGAGAAIPPNADLIFDVELLDCE
ncbi:MAG TPA: FKBP-type peptidyl-prolyl cis-trans isomerase [Turneriella sp.]|nr:FKBP-type peptidyl-prolyl cis-trans isomerase [Turneriella sp.]HNE19820.1 FKBP-type peptidyl-prolyl cis-trans isomerase [Turneriella sp.]HNL11184.1 FKBP-type peptidyl-prolyl cis-trans isomerase [Turneriella sp.]HNL55174.1 FKBP-type peptidyl-prolyl cis-trans isomerase [Turneriella sp.]